MKIHLFICLPAGNFLANQADKYMYIYIYIYISWPKSSVLLFIFVRDKSILGLWEIPQRGTSFISASLISISSDSSYRFLHLSLYKNVHCFTNSLRKMGENLCRKLHFGSELGGVPIPGFSRHCFLHIFQGS